MLDAALTGEDPRLRRQDVPFPGRFTKLDLSRDNSLQRDRTRVPDGEAHYQAAAGKTAIRSKDYMKSEMGVPSPDRAEALDRAARGFGKTFWGGPFMIAFYGRPV